MSKGRVLLVDDEPLIVEQYARALRNEDYEVDTAFSGEEAWEKYQGRYYDAIIADYLGYKDEVIVWFRLPYTNYLERCVSDNSLPLKG